MEKHWVLKIHRSRLSKVPLSRVIHDISKSLKDTIDPEGSPPVCAIAFDRRFAYTSGIGVCRKARGPAV